jgi:hypothetical protein
MALSLSQRATLLAAIQADPTASQMWQAGDSYSLLAWCNADASPAQAVWRTDVQPQESDSAPDYSTYDTALTQGKRDSWVRFLAFQRDFSLDKIRKWVVDCWGAASSLTTNSALILLAGTKNASNAEKIIGGTVANRGQVSALVRSFIGPVTQDEVNRMIANNPNVAGP